MEGEILAHLCQLREELGQEWERLLKEQLAVLLRVKKSGERIRDHLLESSRRVPPLKNYLVLWSPLDEQVSLNPVRLGAVPVTAQNCEDGAWYFLVRCRNRTEAIQIVTRCIVPRKQQRMREKQGEGSLYSLEAADESAMEAWCEVVPTLWTALQRKESSARTLVDRLEMQSVQSLFQVHNFKKEDREVKGTFTFYDSAETLQGREMAEELFEGDAGAEHGR